MKAAGPLAFAADAVDKAEMYLASSIQRLGSWESLLSGLRVEAMTIRDTFIELMLGQ